MSEINLVVSTDSYGVIYDFIPEVQERIVNELEGTVILDQEIKDLDFLNDIDGTIWVIGGNKTSLALLSKCKLLRTVQCDWQNTVPAPRHIRINIKDDQKWRECSYSRVKVINGVRYNIVDYHTVTV